jgi:error-prone DNA polymerase
MLSLVEECLELISRSGKSTPNLDRIDFDDQRVYEMIRRGDTIGVFQIESRAQIQMLPRTQPENLEHLVVQVAIVRPGPIIGGAVNPYVRHREQQRSHDGVLFRPTYDHPRLERVLEETLGVVLYQEQVIAVAMELAGFTAGQADQLRRAMSRKRSREAMVRLWGQFRDGSLDQGVPLTTAQTVFKKLLGFAEYGFPKCHAAAFAMLAYQSAWLRCHYPTEFACALLNNQPMGFYPPHVLINDAKRHDVRVLPPDVNESGVRCTVEGNAVRIGLGYVVELGAETASRLVAERAANGRYRSLADLVRRVPLRVEAAENLVAVGAAADCFGLGRREALWQIGLFLPARNFGGGRTSKEPGTQLALALPTKQDAVELPPMGAWEQMTTDYGALTLSPRYHPLGLLRSRLPKGITSTADLADLPDGLDVRVAGLVVCRQRPGTAKGITFLLLEDELGLINVVVYPNIYQRNRHVVRAEPFLLVEGRLQRRDGTVNVLAREIRPLGGARDGAEPAAPARDIDILAAKGGHEPAERSIADLRAIAPAAHNYR